MNARTARRKRIIRVRTVEHQMAEANLARATGELASLVELSKRLETLRADLAMAKGEVAGRALNTIGELGMRLDMAKENLVAPLVNASSRRDQAGVVAQSAMVKEESAVRLYERSRLSDVREQERRTDANRPHRRRAMSLRLLDGGAA
ncbi:MULTISPECIES: hypothetical protein [unclassified Sphingopyxis]|uniref:hypothetical protein n=1 Tax=unclassified Sphingopyxis TaxID=2614943 RepID=UPI000730FF51|nr:MULTISPECIES: hypothetical protein [unclassified Sphingopyxis]MBD3734730.1 hypothetical protein [Sphingopyxis sp.]KTE23633.1 hypothetical protein ATE61_16965 [Sphingopyxis sp. H057]KTE50057.1 hypothetical protein ATE64_18210 [Sphingopyxis sp. H073]KTE53225.1 hypothetical protein ATE69_12950 [Sphingopyxis sp. H071]KTE59530.1 hypothetical protein ATE66_11310 [Sphingopyxis sp. H107]